MRYLVCLDAQPAADGSCAQTAFVEVAGWRDVLPTVDQANDVGLVFFTSLVTLAAFKSLLQPPRSKDE